MELFNGRSSEPYAILTDWWGAYAGPLNFSQFFEVDEVTFDAGMELTEHSKNAIFRVTKDRVYYSDADGYVHTDKTADPKDFEALCIVSPMEGIHAINKIRRILFKDTDIKMSLSDTRYYNEYKMLTGYKRTTKTAQEERGVPERVRYDNYNYERLIINQLKEGDNVEKLIEIEKNTIFGEAVKKKGETSIARGVSEAFVKDVCVKPKIKYYDGERPYFYVDFSGTSRVDLDFVKAHRRDFYRQTIFHLKSNKTYMRFGIPENYWCVERFTFLCDKTIELVVGLKPELFEVERNR